MKKKAGKNSFTTIFFVTALLICLFTSSASVAQGPEAEKTAAQVLGRPLVEYKAQGLRDPFQRGMKAEEAQKAEEVAPAEVPETPPPNFTVQGIIYSETLSQAIINDKVVKVGDTIDGASIVSINKDSIIILFNGKKYNIGSPEKSAITNNPQGG